MVIFVPYQGSLTPQLGMLTVVPFPEKDDTRALLSVEVARQRSGLHRNDCTILYIPNNAELKFHPIDKASSNRILDASWLFDLSRRSL